MGSEMRGSLKQWINLANKALNEVYFPNGIALIPEEKKRELIEYIDARFKEIEKK